MKKFVFLYFGLVFTFFSIQGCQNQLRKNSSRFLVLGHAYGTPGEANLAIDESAFQSIQKLTKLKKYDFVVFTGDVLRSSDTVNFIKLKNQLDLLSIPYHITPGNHDMGNRPLYKSYIGKTDYFTMLNDDLFIFLDNTKNGWNLEKSQSEVIKTALSNITSKSSIFIFIHNVWWYKQAPQVKINSTVGAHKVDLKKILNTHFSTINNEVFIIAGDVGTKPNEQNCSHHQYNNVHLLTSGIGTKENEHFLEIQLDTLVHINKIDLVTLKKSSFQQPEPLTFKIQKHE